MRYYFILIFLIGVSLAAQLTFTIPGYGFEIPITGQTLAILTFAMYMRPMEIGFAVICYILLGIIGLPIFSDGNAGWSAFSGGSLGYFIGFLLGGMAVSSFSKKDYKRNLFYIFFLQVLGTGIILGMGTLILTFEHGIINALKYGCYPFLIGGLGKIILATIVVTFMDKYWFTSYEAS